VSDLDLHSRFACDLADPEAATRAIDEWLLSTTTPDIVVSNAGGSMAESFDDLTLELWQAELALNLTGAFLLTSRLVPLMARRGSGALVCIASVNGLAYFGNPGYTAAKAGLIAYARAAAVEHGRSGVRVNVVCPGSVRTPAWDHRFERDPDIAGKLLPHYPLGRLVTPDEVANAAVFLASPAASGITGTVLEVDAGLTAGNLRFVDEIVRRAPS
jgi:NAD(P)-dependent dehydrogenase (short-subunit alcohol dehydrogenase family)